ncbi:MAG: hypothetical protein SPI61_07520 [Ezakiella sp.]|uniref:hypothetical protein n=1 Tax=Ezakiella TaxID=1582879 RepID=UPI002014E017|nr:MULTISPECIES: hypothetical protein [Ezakiella]MDD7731155.1 hypothetical protein [Eubacteriales bacterium]MDY6080556.1 hypothetical protein [Ezakiella sp.]UQK61407.1 hypothetical protein M1R54_03675 [Ezakiella coagulans]
MKVLRSGRKISGGRLFGCRYVDPIDYCPKWQGGDCTLGCRTYLFCDTTHISYSPCPEVVNNFKKRNGE